MNRASLRAAEALFAASGLTMKYIAADDPQVEDDEIQIFRNGVDTHVRIQVALIGGGYYVNEWQVSAIDATMNAMIPRGAFRALGKAIGRAIETVAAKDRAA